MPNLSVAKDFDRQHQGRQTVLISRIRGKLVEKKLPGILLEVGGLTYEVQVPMTTAYQLPEVGNELQLHTHFVVREDAQQLYGFFKEKDRTLFRFLIRVSGVGPKLALAILSGMETNEFVRSVRGNDVSAMVNMPGVGKKTAERLIVEMRDCLKDWDQIEPGSSQVSAEGTLPSDLGREAETALMALGYKSQQAIRVVATVMKQHPDVTDSETLIRLSLKSML